MTTHRITVDASPSSALVVCSCRWRQLEFDPAAAWRAGAAHEAACHPSQVQARTVVDVRNSRARRTIRPA